MKVNPFSVFYYTLIVGLLILIIGQATGAGATGTSYQEDKAAAHEAAELMRSYGYPEDNPVIQAASTWWWETDAAEQTEQTARSLTEENTEVRQIEAPAVTITEAQREEYPVACGVWRYLREDMGLSAPVAAGILGNMMAECGGQTLELQPYLCVNNFLGLCMWYAPYTNGRLTYGADVTDQLKYLSDTLETNMEYFGGDYEYFCGLESATDAAWYFSEYYERGGWHYVRARNAETALEYFGEG